MERKRELVGTEKRKKEGWSGKKTGRTGSKEGEMEAGGRRKAASLRGNRAGDLEKAFPVGGNARQSNKQTQKGEAPNVGKVQRTRKAQNGSGLTGNGEKQALCPIYKKCGGCDYQGVPYEEQLKIKEDLVRKLLAKYCKVQPIIGMDNPYHYRNKVHAVFDHDRKGNAVSGVYQKGTHYVVPVEECMIENRKADEIIGSVRELLKSFKIKTYDEDTGYGLLRHVLVKRGFATKQIMVVLVTASPVFPSKNNFVNALRRLYPEITTIVQNVNGRGTSMVLGDQEKVLYGKGYIEDVLCGCTFRISSKSFYQINPVQTELLYKKAIDLAGLTGEETVLDAYCGIGTIGLIAGKKAGSVIGVELNKDAIRDAIINARLNNAQNIRFFCADAGEFMEDMAQSGEKVDVVFMDPPRSGSDERFLNSMVKMNPKRVVYISCNPETQARDIEYLRGMGYEAKEAWPVDMFPFTGHVETVVLMTNVQK